uniref:N-acetyltransferase domain-containing protein n=1 Tax=Panagrolaimus sp. JU765 TaxID=591449 RepID=A0AC34Q9D4_9BILA
MPDHVQKALYIDALFIDPKLHKMGLGEYMLTTGLRRGVEQGAQMSYVFAVATGTQKVYLSQPGPCKLLVIPYDKFLENGKPVFKKLNDGAKTCVTIIKEFKQN